MNLGIWLVLLGLMIIPGLIAQAMVHSAIKKYSAVPARSGRTGAQAAAEIMRDAGIRDVAIEQGDGFLGDHYDPSKKKLVLSSSVYNSRSVAAVGIAAHEAGHAIQHRNEYAPLQARMTVVPATTFVSHLWPLVIIGGFWFRIPMFITLGIIVMTVLVIFQLITLPVEFDASKRAKLILQQNGMIAADEMVGINRVLNAAALTYVAALVASVAQLIELILRQRR